MQLPVVQALFAADVAIEAVQVVRRQDLAGEEAGPA
jgi:hypothetical protein